MSPIRMSPICVSLCMYIYIYIYIYRASITNRLIGSVRWPGCARPSGVCCAGCKRTLKQPTGPGKEEGGGREGGEGEAESASAWPGRGDGQRLMAQHGLYSSVVERQFRKLKLLGSIPSGGFIRFDPSRGLPGCKTRILQHVWVGGTCVGWWASDRTVLKARLFFLKSSPLRVQTGTAARAVGGAVCAGTLREWRTVAEDGVPSCVAPPVCLAARPEGARACTHAHIASRKSRRQPA